ncbi:MAG: hypothetical protein F4Y84_01020 [Caldilineaceae bacterium SB0665_bin_25]|nr:hypothetical protein [Caldilineaceae bacterium SB0665_bin_25]
MPACIAPLIVVAILILVVVLIVRASQREAEKERQRQIELERRRIEAERRRVALKEKYDAETPERRKLIAQLYADGIDLKEITFILRRAGYNSPAGEQITMKEIMEEHADMQIEKHKGQQTDSAEDVTKQA